MAATFLSFGPAVSTRSQCNQGALEASTVQTGFEPPTTEQTAESLSDLS